MTSNASDADSLHPHPRLHPVIIAGGSGTRFWPVSRAVAPKQLQPILSEQTMLELSIDRALALAPPERSWLITGAATSARVRALAGALPDDHLVFEPVGKDTAAAIGLAAIHVAHADPEGVMLVLTADHMITPIEAFAADVARAAALADGGDLVTFGIKPDHPATGYGYIEAGDVIPGQEGASRAFRVARFCEKPDLATAERFVAGGRHHWNSGMFCWRASRILAEIETHLPDLSAHLARIAESIGSPAADSVLASEFASIEQKISIDFGVMERASSVAGGEASFGWDDVGSWEAVSRHVEADADGNHVRGGRLESLDARDLVVVLPDDHLVAAIGVSDLAIVVTGDATLVCPRSRVQEVKKIVESLRAGEGAPWL